MKRLGTWTVGLLAAVLLVAAPRNYVVQVDYKDFIRAIRADDLATLRSLIGAPDAMKVESRLHMQPLHYAALYGL